MRFAPGPRTSGRRWLALSAATATAFACVLFATPSASAHTGSLFHGVWASSARGAVPIYAESNLTDAAHTRALAGAKAWDNLGESLDFVSKGTKNLSRDPCNRAVRGQNLVGMRPLDGRGKDLAMTTVCRSGGTIVRFVTVFDSAEDWYTGTSTTVPRGRPDLWSVAVHEFGHAAGWAAHFDDAGIGLGAGLCGNFSGQHTMCATHYSGTARQRSLGPHDVDTFRLMY
jgi:hypothetical protein